jgi:hypothetical protein
VEEFWTSPFEFSCPHVYHQIEDAIIQEFFDFDQVMEWIGKDWGINPGELLQKCSRCERVFNRARKEHIEKKEAKKSLQAGMADGERHG